MYSPLKPHLRRVKLVDALRSVCRVVKRICKMLTTDIARFGLPFKAGCGKDPSVGSW